MSEPAVDERVLRLAETLFKNTLIKSRFYLAGGTALALQLNHRKSFDIDLFSYKEFNTIPLTEYIIKQKGMITYSEQGTIHCSIKKIKVSFLHYPYLLLNPLIKLHNVKIASLQDIACMKAVAISQRAEKKDFFDVYQILQNHTPVEFKNMFLKKYQKSHINCYHILRSLFYFDDVENSPEPISSNGTTWRMVKKWFVTHEKEITKALLC
jgi:hypothetical protein